MIAIDCSHFQWAKTHLLIWTTTWNLFSNPQKKQGRWIFSSHLFFLICFWFACSDAIQQLTPCLLSPVLRPISIKLPASSPPGDINKLILPANSLTWPEDNLIHDLFFMVKSEIKVNNPVIAIDWVTLNFKWVTPVAEYTIIQIKFSRPHIENIPGRLKRPDPHHERKR